MHRRRTWRAKKACTSAGMRPQPATIPLDFAGANLEVDLGNFL